MSGLFLSCDGYRNKVLVESDLLGGDNSFELCVDGELVDVIDFAKQSGEPALLNINQICDSGFNSKNDYWQPTVESSEGFTLSVDFGEKWVLQDGHTAYLFQSETHNDSIELVYHDPVIGELLPVSAGEYYQVGGSFGCHRCDASLIVEFYDSDKKKLQQKKIDILPVMPGGQSLEDYLSIAECIRIPHQASFIRLALLKLPTNPELAQNSSFFFFTRLFFVQVAASDVPFSGWSECPIGLKEWEVLRKNGLQQYVSVNFQLPGIVYDGLTHTIDIIDPKIAQSIDGSPKRFTSKEIHKVLFPAIKNVSRSLEAIFDDYYYQSSLSDISIDLIEHYKKIGWKKFISATPYFDIAWYLTINKELINKNLDPLTHFLTIGCKELQDPHPLFNLKWYYEKYLAEDEPTEHPFFHYLDKGWKKGFSPNPLFWPEWYTKTYIKELSGSIDPFYHYLVYGWRLGYDPNPLFSINYYTNNYQSKEALNPDPLSHYFHVGWRKEYNTHQLFDAKYFQESMNRKVDGFKYSPLQYLLENPDSPSSHPLFDVSFYREQVKTELTVHPVVDYIARGPNGSIDPHPLFSKKYYFQHAPDILIYNFDPLIHYLNSGYKEGRHFHPLFNPHFYSQFLPGEKESNLQSSSGTKKLAGAKELNPLIHYLAKGYGEGLPCRFPEQPDQTPKPLPGSRNVIEMPVDKLFGGKEISDEQVFGKIGVFAHIFYPDLAEEMLSATNNIPDTCTIYISTDTAIKAKEIDATCRQVSKHPFEIRLLPNRGRDIAPMLVGFRDRLLEVDYAVHIHSKKSKHYAREFESWRRYLINGNLGSKELVRNILGLLANEKIGAYTPDHYAPIRKLIQWGGNFSTLASMLGLCGQQLTKEHCLDFPSGSMFWFKPKALQPLFDLHLRFYHFDAEKGQVDGTLAHAIERGFFYFVECAGYDWVVGHPVANGKALNAVSHQLIGQTNRFLPCNNEQGELRHYYPECTKFFVRPSIIKKPRLNLLIPTVDTSVGYAGVSTALDVFHAIREKLGDKYDARMIATDTSPSNQYNPPLGYTFIEPLDGDIEDQDVVIDGAQRFRFPFFVRENDIFMATAWWTAQNALDILKQQEQIFSIDSRAFVYLIQDFECGFYPWSTKYALADQTYRHPEKTIPVFNTDILFEFFKEHHYYDQGNVLYPGINMDYKKAINHSAEKEKLVLLYARPHAERNCLPFIDVLIQEVIKANPEFWADWRFLAIGEDFKTDVLKSCKRIEVLGRLTIDEYAILSSNAALAVSLMESPHPSYPPLEMAEAGVLVIANNYDQKDLSAAHENIFTFSAFDIDDVAKQIKSIADMWMKDKQIGWKGKAKIDWFFGGKSSLEDVANSVSDIIKKSLVQK